LRDVANFRSSDSQGTISAWINLNNSSTYQVIFGSADYASSNRYIEIFIRSDRKIAFAQWNANGVNDDHIYGNTVLVSNKWYYIAVSSNGSIYTLYVNGVR
ncbi:LamG domain-containing protein, partial [Patescibacteria group bacterium]|nr:LamG domain-containing protein [Patescibacteria group bacterium]